MLRRVTYIIVLVVRDDPAFVAKHGRRKCFHLGGNSSCRTHIRSHYDVYKDRCEAENITVNHRAIPREIWKAMEAAKKAKKGKQGTLQFTKVQGPQEFTREGVLQSVAKFIVCDDQVEVTTKKRKHQTDDEPVFGRSKQGHVPELFDFHAASCNHF